VDPVGGYIGEVVSTCRIFFPKVRPAFLTRVPLGVVGALDPILRAVAPAAAPT
jgi:hypothetical protein